MKNDNSYIEKIPMIWLRSNVKEYFENYVGVFKLKKIKKKKILFNFQIQFKMI